MSQTVWEMLVICVFALSVVQAVVMIGLIRQVGSISLQLLPGAHPGAIEGGPDLGQTVEVPLADTGRPTVVVFVSPTCQVCGPILPALPIVAAHFREVQVVAAIIGGDPISRAELARDIGSTARLDLLELETEWRVPGTPFAVAIASGGRVVSTGVTNSLDHLEQLAEMATDAARQTPTDEQPARVVLGAQTISGGTEVLG
jgi:hypothetical protein